MTGKKEKKIPPQQMREVGWLPVISMKMGELCQM
jgi:hypothetical protein